MRNRTQCLKGLDKIKVSFALFLLILQIFLLALEREEKEKEEKEKEDEGVKKLNVTSPTPVHITAPDTTSPSLCDITKIPQATNDSTDTEEDVVTMTTAVRDDDGITEGTSHVGATLESPANTSTTTPVTETSLNITVSETSLTIPVSETSLTTPVTETSLTTPVKETTPAAETSLTGDTCPTTPVIKTKAAVLTLAHSVSDYKQKQDLPKTNKVNRIVLHVLLLITYYNF